MIYFEIARNAREREEEAFANNILVFSFFQMVLHVPNLSHYSFANTFFRDDDDDDDDYYYYFCMVFNHFYFFFLFFSFQL